MTVSLNKLSLVRAIHPGEILAGELEFTGISQREIARQLAMPVSVLNEVIRGKRRLSADLAVKLEAVLDVSADHWNNLQAAYDLDQARIQQQQDVRLPALAALRDVRNHVPISELKKRGILIDDAVEDVRRLLHLYRANTTEELVKIVENRIAIVDHFRRSEKLNTNAINLTAWVMLAHEAARLQEAALFDSAMNQQSLLTDIHQLLIQNQDVVNGLTNRLSAAGIKLVIIEHLPQTPIDGMAWWCEKGECPAIALTLRHHRLDNLIFTLFHELGHVFLHLGKDTEICEFLDFESNSDKLSSAEEEANSWASNNLAPVGLLQNFLNSRQRMQDDYLQSIARQANISPAILLGQRCYALRDFKQLKQAEYNKIG